MSVFDIALVLSTLLCSLVAGFLFAYAVVVMPGLKNLEDKVFVKAFQITDRVIQDNSPLFLLVWVGSSISLIVCALYGFVKLQGVDRFLLLLASAAYLLGVQAPTIIVHLPMNNELQKHDVDSVHKEELNSARVAFEQRWNRSNQIRTAIACCVSLLLIVIVLRR